MGRKDHWDFWKKHATPTKQKDARIVRWECNYCRKEYAGGVSRVKTHFGRVKRDIDICRGEVPEHVREAAEQALPNTMRSRRKTGTSSSKVRPQVADSRNTRPSLRYRALHVPPQGIRAMSQDHNDAIQQGGQAISEGYNNGQSNMSNSESNIGGANLRHQLEDDSRATGHDMQEDSNLNNLMQTNQDRNNERNMGNPSEIPQPSSQMADGARDTGRDKLFAPDLVGDESQRIVNMIYDWLMTDKNISHIGVYGMGGVGKTTALKHLYDKLVRNNSAFRDVFWVTVSKDCTIHELQDKIATETKALDLFKNQDVVKRSTLLFKHLSEKRNSLIILDDMWRHFELNEVGIPVTKDGIQIVLTTRYLDVCKRMLCQETVRIQPLSQVEAWSLFIRTLGFEPSLSRRNIAERIVKECGGLPLAIGVMAQHIRGVDTDHGWRDTLVKLEQAQQQDMQRVVFPILLDSYDRLDGKKQQCLLRCALYPAIDKQKLIEFYIDEGLICGDSRYEMYDEGHQLLDELEKACLLEYRNEDVRVHGMIRGMLLFITNEKRSCPYMVKSRFLFEETPHENHWLPNLQKASLSNIGVVPSISPNCPQLSTLLLNCNRHLYKIPNCFFKKLRQLEVIDLSGSSIGKLPTSITNLRKLKA